jgi:hypothetical protein
VNVSVANYLENKVLDLVFRATSYAGQSTVYVQLHTGDPGEDGTANVASNSTRKGVTFAAASAGTSTSSADAAWTNVPASETYSHISLWDNSTGGNCLWYGALTASKAVSAGDNFTIASGSLTVSLD